MHICHICNVTPALNLMMKHQLVPSILAHFKSVCGHYMTASLDALLEEVSGHDHNKQNECLLAGQSGNGLLFGAKEAWRRDMEHAMAAQHRTKGGHITHSLGRWPHMQMAFCQG